MENDIYNFLPIYNETDKVDYTTLNKSINQKKEFLDLKLSKVESYPTSPGVPLMNQKFLARLISSNTPYDELLVYHSMGSGKTCAVINIIENIINDENTNLNSSSSCLIPNQNNDGYLMNIRYVNYKIEENGNYLNCDKYIISVNKFIELDKQFNIKTEKWMELKFDNRRYIGIEDIRIFNDIKTNNLLFLGTGYHHNDKIGIVNGIYDVNSGLFNEVEINPDFCYSSCEKNWVFVDYNDSSHIVYNWHPLKICKINENKNLLSLVETKNTPKIFSRIRGSSCGFKYSKKFDSCNNGNVIIDITEDEIWFVTHLVSYETPRHYYHLIAVFDSNMNLLRYSAPFKFEGESIEYCLSIVVEDERVLINYSTWDRTTQIGIYDKKYIDSIVKYT